MSGHERGESANNANSHQRRTSPMGSKGRSALAVASLGLLLNHCAELDERNLNEASGGAAGAATGGTKGGTTGGLSGGTSGKSSSGSAQGTGGPAVGGGGQTGNSSGGTTSTAGTDTAGGGSDPGSGGANATGGGDSQGGTSGGSSPGGKGGGSPGGNGGSDAAGGKGSAAGGSSSAMGGSSGNSSGGKSSTGGTSSGGKSGTGGTSSGGKSSSGGASSGGSSSGGTSAGKGGSGSGGASCSSNLTTDPMNCGVCGRVCPSGSCVASVCQAVTYSVTYNGNGSLSGTIPVDSMKYQQGETVTVPANPGALARRGYVFSGWNTKSDGKGTNYASGTGTFQMGTINTTLYAKWIIQDASGNIYTDTTIGSQVWMIENLKTSKYNDGATIAAVPDLCDGTGRVWAGDPIYGAYYNGHAVRTGKLAPTGWRVPTVNDWKTLVASTQNNAKSIASTLNWRSSTSTGAVGNNQSANNSTGFYALPGGHYTATATNGTIGFETQWWTTNFYTEEGTYYGDHYYIAYDDPTIEPNGPTQACAAGLSVRLVRDY